MTNILHDPNDSRAQAMLRAPVIAWDVETNTAPFHWETKSRGLSVVANMTEISFYDGGDNILVLSAVPRQAHMPYTSITESNGEIHFEDSVLLDQTDYAFTDEQQNYVRQMFSRTDEVTFVAHNLVFDARQTFAKFEITPHDNWTLWDTKTVFQLGWKWMPTIDLNEPSDEGDDDEDDETTAVMGHRVRANLLEVYEVMVQQLDPAYRQFISFMKSQRKHFPNMALHEMEGKAIAYLPPEFHQRIYDYQARYNHFKSLRGKARAEAKPEDDLSDIERWCMDVYAAFDVIAAFEIYSAQFNNPPPDYPEYPRLLQGDLDYVKWTAEVAARGLRVDRDFVQQKLQDCYAGYRRILTEELGYGLEYWDIALKNTYLAQLIFWNNELDSLVQKKDKSYAKNMKLRMAEIEMSREMPNADEIVALQDAILTKGGRAKLRHILNMPWLKDIFFTGAPGNYSNCSPETAWTHWEQYKITILDFSYGARALKVWIGLYPELKPQLSKIARLSKLNGAITYLKMIFRESEWDGRVHTNLGKFAGTSRNTSQAPNLQNAHFDYEDPVLDMAGVFIGDPGAVLVEFDFSGAENFTAAMLSMDDALARACCAEDFHAWRARLMFGEEFWSTLDEDGKLRYRKYAKTLGFGIMYGMGLTKLALSLDKTKDEARALVDKLNTAFPAQAQMIERLKDWAATSGYVRTWAGRRLGLERFGNKVKAYASWNYVNQGAVAEIVSLAILKINKWLRDHGYRSYLTVQIHDSVIANLFLDEIDEAYTIVRGIIECMATVLDGVVREKVSTPDNKVLWNNSTTPHVRWLTDMCPSNAMKWGKQNGVTYPLRTDIYANRWGIHQMPVGAKKCPTWINEHGWGMAALDKELEGSNYRGGEFSTEGITPFNWTELQQAINQAQALCIPRTFGDRVLPFHEAMLVRQSAYERGQGGTFLEELAHFRRVAAYFDKFEKEIGTRWLGKLDS